MVRLKTHLPNSPIASCRAFFPPEIRFRLQSMACWAFNAFCHGFIIGQDQTHECPIAHTLSLGMKFSANVPISSRHFGILQVKDLIANALLPNAVVYEIALGWLRLREHQIVYSWSNAERHPSDYPSITKEQNCQQRPFNARYQFFRQSMFLALKYFLPRE